MDDEERAGLVMRFADLLLPGDGLFPAAGATGMAGPLCARLAAAEQGAVLHGLLAALEAGVSEAVVAGIERGDPKLFEKVRTIVYVTYYEQDAVVAAVRALGMPYNATPLPEGYAPEPFDTAIDAPKHRRGGWTPTDRVARVDLASLDGASQP
jgi:hypothetical protein